MQGVACLALAHYLNQRLQRLHLLALQPESRKEFAGLFGADCLDGLLKSDRAEARREIEALLERAVKEFGAVERSLVNDLREKPFALIGVHVGGSSAADVEVLMERENLPWRTFVDPGQAAAGPIARSWNSPSTPTFFVLDASGVIRHRWVGKVDPRVVDSVLEELLRGAANDRKK
jgi:hypothetical protein